MMIVVKIMILNLMTIMIMMIDYIKTNVVDENASVFNMIVAAATAEHCKLVLSMMPL